MATREYRLNLTDEQREAVETFINMMEDPTWVTNGADRIHRHNMESGLNIYHESLVRHFITGHMGPLSVYGISI